MWRSELLKKRRKGMAKVALKKVEAKEQKVEIVLEPLNVGLLKVKIKGQTPLILENWSIKTRQQMAEKHKGEQTGVSLSARDPEAEAKEKLYLTSKGKYAFPASGLKKAMVSACTSTNKKITKTFLIQAIHVLGTEGNLVEFTSPGYRVQEDIGRVGPSKTPRPIWRPVFDEWNATFLIRYNKNIIAPSQIVNMLNLAGFAVGLCGWRVEKSGSFGMFSVVSSDEKTVA
jgi:hypothetical protein